MLSARRRWWLVTAAALAMTLVTARLGWWQLDRAAQKLAAQAAVDERARLPAIDQVAQLAGGTEAAASQHHRLLRLSGRWLPAS